MNLKGDKEVELDEDGEWVTGASRGMESQDLFNAGGIYQLRILESFFQRKKYPNLPEAEMLSGMKGITYPQPGHSAEQRPRRILESFFQRKKYPNLPEAEMLSGMKGITYPQIRVWFQNRRGKHRRLYAGDRTPGSSLSALQPRPYAEPAHGPLSPFDWPANPVCSGPDPALPWALQGPASSAFDSRVHLPPRQTAPSPGSMSSKHNPQTPV
nr:homeobox protein DLX-3-like [Pelodiscus sinensis]|eukprot:XP_014429090.2 homeobox protein DLX-3-like [Pelodiscus sinensis]